MKSTRILNNCWQDILSYNSHDKNDNISTHVLIGPTLSILWVVHSMICSIASMQSCQSLGRLLMGYVPKSHVLAIFNFWFYQPIHGCYFIINYDAAHWSVSTCTLFSKKGIELGKDMHKELLVGWILYIIQGSGWALTGGRSDFSLQEILKIREKW